MTQKNVRTYERGAALADLAAYVRKEFGDKIEIAVAGFWEGHSFCHSLESEIASRLILLWIRKKQTSRKPEPNTPSTRWMSTALSA
ncbi:MAG: hypothetical protein ACOYBE_04120 [Blautia sp.]